MSPCDHMDVVAGIDSTEFLDSVDSYDTFNDFFYRKLKPETR